MSSQPESGTSSEVSREGGLEERQALLKAGVVNGVFKGGGAKGIAYAGALQAVEERGLRFGAVAGTSAGAMTATLVAAGFSAADVATMVPKLLGTLSGRVSALVSWVRLIVGFQDARYSNKGLGTALEALIHDRHGTVAGPVTFRDLSASGVTLYVVALDLATSTPVVFSVHTTPDVSVTSAVLASSAIPGAFPSVRAVGRSALGPVTHRLVDGGAWANFPRFVFQDDSFRRMVETRTGVDLSAERERQTLLFALDNSTGDEGFLPDQVEHLHAGPVSFDRGTLQTAKNPALWLFGTYMTSNLLRLLFAISLAGMLYALALGTRTAFLNVSSFASQDTTGLSPLLAVSIGTLTVLIGCMVAGLMLVLWGTSKIIGTTLIPAAQAALAVGTGVAPWVGYGSGDYLIRVPYGNLETTGFQVSDGELTDAVNQGYLVSLRQIAQLQGDEPPPQQTSSPSDPAALPSLRPLAVPGLLMLVPLLVSTFLTTVILLEYEYSPLLIVTLVGCVVLAFGSLYVGARSAAGFHDAISRGASATSLEGKRGRLVVIGLVAAGCLAIGAGTMFAAQLQRDYRTYARQGTITSVQVPESKDLAGRGYLYSVAPFTGSEVEGQAVPTFLSSARIPVGQRMDFAVRTSGQIVPVRGLDTQLLAPAALQFCGVLALILAGWAAQVRSRAKRLSLQ